MEDANKLIEYCISENRVCPQPILWNKLWEMLKNKKQNSLNWQPPLPLILAAWHTTSDSDKQLRFLEHIRWAESQGQLKEIYDFLIALKQDEWHYLIG